MKGRKATPPSLKLLTGNPGRRPVHDGPDSPALDAGDPAPGWLHEYAKDYYAEIVQTLAKMSVATEADRLAIVALAQSLCEVKIAHEQLNKIGRLVKNSKGGAERNPYGVHAAQFLAFVRHFVTEFGMTPCSRARLVAKATGAEDSPFAKYMSGLKK